jgi:hypothetical protein
MDHHPNAKHPMKVKVTMTFEMVIDARHPHFGIGDKTHLESHLTEKLSEAMTTLVSDKRETIDNVDHDTIRVVVEAGG